MRQRKKSFQTQFTFIFISLWIEKEAIFALDIFKTPKKLFSLQKSEIEKMKKLLLLTLVYIEEKNRKLLFQWKINRTFCTQRRKINLVSWNICGNRCCSSDARDQTEESSVSRRLSSSFSSKARLRRGGASPFVRRAYLYCTWRGIALHLGHSSAHSERRKDWMMTRARIKYIHSQNYKTQMT